MSDQKITISNDNVALSLEKEEPLLPLSLEMPKAWFWAKLQATLANSYDDYVKLCQ
jgi:hypothetical protein